MAPKSAAQSLADAAALCLGLDDVAGVLVGLLSECRSALPADAVAILVTTETPARERRDGSDGSEGREASGGREGHGGLELLSSTSHEVGQLELHETLQDGGPCLGVLRTATQVSARSPDELVERWDLVGRRAVDAGFRSLHAVPIRWRGNTFGALVAFSQSERTLAVDDARLLQAFGDVASLAMVTPSGMSLDILRERVGAALHGRTVIERAKGVLRYREGLTYAAADGELVRRAALAGHSLTEVAEDVLRSVQPGAATG